MKVEISCKMAQCGSYRFYFYSIRIPSEILQYSFANYCRKIDLLL